MYSRVLPEKAIRSPTSTVQGKMAVPGGKNALAGDYFFHGIGDKGLAELVEVMYVCKTVNFGIQAANTFNK